MKISHKFLFQKYADMIIARHREELAKAERKRELIIISYYNKLVSSKSMAEMENVYLDFLSKKTGSSAIEKLNMYIGRVDPEFFQVISALENSVLYPAEHDSIKWKDIAAKEFNKWKMLCATREATKKGSKEAGVNLDV